MNPFGICSAERPSLDEAKAAMRERWESVDKIDAKADGTFEKSCFLDIQAFAVGKNGAYRWLILPKS